MKKANIEWKETHKDNKVCGLYVPVSTHFDDVYYNPNNPVAESLYNFIDGCDVATSFNQAGTVCIGETGFGTGLNFFLTLEKFLSSASDEGVLHYYTVEKFPVAKEDMHRALHGLLEKSIEMKADSLKLNKATLDSSYCAGSTRITPIHTVDTQNIINTLLNALSDNQQSGMQVYTMYGSKVHLHIYYGDVLDWLGADKFNFPDAIFDYVYLDGFTPSKNPDMWQENVLQGLYNKTKVGGAFATFTSASRVRRALENVGFNVRKTKGYGCKRDRLIGVKI